MATIMEKDVLLEYANFGYLIDDETLDGEQDLIKMHEIKEYLYDTNYANIDYESIKEQIKTLRQKYEN